MDKEIITFDDIEKHKFHDYKNLFFFNDVYIDNILIPNRISSGEKNHKYFTGYIDEYKIKPFSITLPI